MRVACARAPGAECCCLHPDDMPDSRARAGLVVCVVCVVCVGGHTGRNPLHVNENTMGYWVEKFGAEV